MPRSFVESTILKPGENRRALITVKVILRVLRFFLFLYRERDKEADFFPNLSHLRKSHIEM